MIELPRSTYYYQSTAKCAGSGDARLVEPIEEIHDEFPGYGYRRETRELCNRGLVVNPKRVARVMRQHGLKARIVRRFKQTTDSDHELPVFPNLYGNVIPTKPDEVWVGDLTYIRTVFGFAYLAALLDACSRKVVGCAKSRRMDAELTLAALHAAYRNRRPPPGSCIHHTDLGQPLCLQAISRSA